MRHTPPTDPTQAPIDPAELLRTPLGELLVRLAQPTTQWVDLRDPTCPVLVRHAMAAHRRGELAVSRVGTRLLVRRDDLDAWISSQRLPTDVPDDEPVPTYDDLAAQLGYRRVGGVR